jgi:DNA segregation ATPase FtsK/SpoIIIE, S-DNA-T family
MAKKNSNSKAENTKKSAPKEKTESQKKRSEKSQIISGILLLLIALFLFSAFFSFLFNAEADQSKLQGKWLELIKNPEIEVDNLTGKTGAWIANVFINQWFGIASFFFIYLLVLYALKLFNLKISKPVLRTIKSLISILWISIAFGFIFSRIYDSWSVYPGGMFGYHIAMWMKSLIGGVGTFFLLLATLFIYIVIVFDKALDWFRTIPMLLFSSKKDSDLKPVAKKGLFSETELEKRATSKPSPKTENEEPRKKTSVYAPDETRVNERYTAPTSTTEDDEDDDEDEDFEIEDTVKSEANPITTILGEREDDLDLTVEIPDVVEEEYENRPLEDYDPTLDLSHYQYPPLELLEDYSHLKTEVSEAELTENKDKIVDTLRNFKIEITKIKATIGPTVTLYEIIPDKGVRISKIKNLEDDIALSLSALGIRIIAPIPGRGTIGIEVPNRNPQMVSMRSIIGSKKFMESTAELPVAMGRTISNEIFIFDLAKMPHILVAGATGQGKSVGLNAIITSLLYKKHPSQLKFVFIDPKKVELNLYATIEKHFLAKLPEEEEPIITDVEKVKATLNSVGIEMDARYDLLKMALSRNIKEYNKKFIERRLNPEKGHRFLPYIVVVIDEFADLIMTAGKEIELPIARIAQLARAVGIHMVIATQRPSINIITGVIKANFPSRIAFKVASMIDSRTILDQPGANQLIGKGDMLFMAGSELVRLQCAFVDTPEVDQIVTHISRQQCYPTAYLLPEYSGETGGVGDSIDMNNKDEFFDDAARLIVINQQGSTSMIQRKFSIGYNRAGRIMDQLEAAGIVGPSEGSKARRVLIQDEYTLEQLLK